MIQYSWNILKYFKGGIIMYDANLIARYVIYKQNIKAIEITNLKLQKILYYIQGYSLKLLSTPMFTNDICCWSYGPVVPDVYFEYSTSGADPLYSHGFSGSIFTTDQRNLIDKVIESCEKLTPFQLVSKTHSEQPWIGTTSREIIKVETMKNFFSKNDPLNISGVK